MIDATTSGLFVPKSFVFRYLTTPLHLQFCKSFRIKYLTALRPYGKLSSSYTLSLIYYILYYYIYIGVIGVRYMILKDLVLFDSRKVAVIGVRYLILKDLFFVHSTNILPTGEKDNGIRNLEV